MNTELSRTFISFPHETTQSELRNGYAMTTAVAIDPSRQFSQTGNYTHPTVNIESINSRGAKSTGFIRIPMEASVLREIAAALEILADAAEGHDTEGQISQLLAIVEALVSNSKLDALTVEGLFSTILHRVVGESRATTLRGQWREEIREIILAGAAQSLWERLSELSGQTSDELMSYGPRQNNSALA